MKVLLLSNSFGALANFRYEFITQLCERGDEVSLCFPFGENTVKLNHLKCKYIDIPLTRMGTNPISEFRLIRLYISIIRNIKPNIIFSYTIKPNIYGGIAAAHENVPIVQSVTGLGTALETPGLLQKVSTTLYRIACRKSQRIFCQNEEIVDYFRLHHIGGDRVCEIAGSGVNLDYFKCLPYPKGNQTEFLFIARVRKEKGIDQYLEAAEYIRKKYPNTVFHVLGFCDDETYLQILTEKEQQGIIRYHGEQKNVLKFQMLNSCTIHPTYYSEGMSNVLLESAACGRPIITTDRSGCREIIDNSVNGFICKQRDSVDLICQIENFLNLSWKKRRDMGLAGRSKIEKEFDRKIVVARYMAEMDKVQKSGL